MEVVGDKIVVSAPNGLPCRYKLFERDMTTGKTTEYDIDLGRPTYIERKKGLISYSLAVYHESQFLGRTAGRMVFT